jgi:hypothetical protein
MTRVDLATLAAMLGHSRAQPVLRYAHSTEEHQFQQMRIVEAFKRNQQAAGDCISETILQSQENNI